MLTHHNKILTASTFRPFFFKEEFGECVLCFDNGKSLTRPAARDQSEPASLRTPDPQPRHTHPHTQRPKPSNQYPCAPCDRPLRSLARSPLVALSQLACFACCISRTCVVFLQQKRRPIELHPPFAEHWENRCVLTHNNKNLTSSVSRAFFFRRRNSESVLCFDNGKSLTRPAARDQSDLASLRTPDPQPRHTHHTHP